MRHRNTNQRGQGHPARIPLWLSIFVYPVVAYGFHLPPWSWGIWAAACLLILARLPH